MYSVAYMRRLGPLFADLMEYNSESFYCRIRGSEYDRLLSILPANW